VCARTQLANEDDELVFIPLGGDDDQHIAAALSAASRRAAV
jgi:hypothetical protein